MNVRDLIDMLEDFDDNTEVLIAHQPSWPLALELAAVVPDPFIACDGDCEDADGDGRCPHTIGEAELEQTEPAVWIVAGSHPADRSPYAPAALFAGIS